MEKATKVTEGQLIEILDSAPDNYEDFAFCAAACIIDLNLVDEFIEYHEEYPDATADEIGAFIFEAADLRPLPEA